MKRREWFLNEARVAIPIFPGERPGKPDYIHVISADYCESLEREVAALRASIDAAFSDHMSAAGELLQDADCIRDERESGEL